ncbi:MAG: hypothetical protein EZS28_038580, partial [Streblomastix strix]
GGKRLLEIEEENTIVKIFEDKMMLHDFPTQFDAVEIVKDLIKKNPSRIDVAEKINIQWLERFVGYKKQFKLLRGHVVDQKRFWACTRSNLAPWYQKIRQLRYDSNYLLRNIWNADETEEFDELDSDDFRIVANNRGWQTCATLYDYMHTIAIPEFKANKIDVIIIPSHTSHITQPLDCGVNARLKQRLQEVFRYPIKRDVASFRRALVEALKSAVQQALDSEIIKGSF